MQVDVVQAAWDRVTLAWAYTDTRVVEPPRIYVDHVQRNDLAYDVRGKEGRVAIHGLPPGEHTLSVRHEAGAVAVHLVRGRGEVGVREDASPEAPAAAAAELPPAELVREIATLRKSMARQSAHEQRQRARLAGMQSKLKELQYRSEQAAAEAAALEQETAAAEAAAAHAEAALETHQQRLAATEAQEERAAAAHTETLLQHKHAASLAIAELRVLHREREALQNEIRARRELLPGSPRLPSSMHVLHRRADSYHGNVRTSPQLDDTWVPLPRPQRASVDLSRGRESPFKFPVAPRDGE